MEKSDSIVDRCSRKGKQIMKIHYIEPTTEEGVYEELSIFFRTNYPGVDWVFDLSGIPIHESTKRKMTNYRSRRGYPDLFIPEPRNGFHGFYLEIKRFSSSPYRKDGSLKKDKHLEAQDAMMDSLRSKGYYANFAIGICDCVEQIENYLK